MSSLKEVSVDRRIIIAVLAVVVVSLIIFALARTDKSSSGIGDQAKSLYNTAVSLEDKGETNEAALVYQQLVEQFPQAKQAGNSWYALGEIYAKEGLLGEAQAAFEKVVVDFSDFEKITEAKKRLWDLNIKLLFSPVVTEKDIAYKVEPGDTLGAIAKKHNTTVELIKRSNNLESDLIRPGKRLKISAVKYSVAVDKKQSILALKANDAVFKIYAVALGKFDSTPIGEFTITEKLINPDWYKGGVGAIPAQSPENILGTRWLGLSEKQYGIHGGATEEDLGKQVTNGCVRMFDSDVEELFAILPRGTEVAVIE